MKPTQVSRVIAAARSYRGVCQAEFLGPQVCDNGTPITRLAARIQDAEARGFTFELIGWRKRCKVYRLISGPEGETCPPPRASLALSAGEGTEGAASASAPPADMAPVPASRPLSAGHADRAQERLFEAPGGIPHWKAA